MIIKGDWHKKIGKTRQIYVSIFSGLGATTFKDFKKIKNNAPPWMTGKWKKHSSRREKGTMVYIMGKVYIIPEMPEGIVRR